MTDIAFLNHLASTKTDAEFASAAAGFAALQLYDSVKTHGFDLSMHGDVLQRVTHDITRIDAAQDVRTALESMMQALPFWENGGPIRVGRRAVYTTLLMYGQALSSEGEWRIAESV